MLIWIIDEEWKDYDLEYERLPKLLPGVEIKTSTYDYEKDLEEFGYRADGILAQVYAHIPKSTIDRLENCKVIATYGGGYDRIDVEACKKKSIMVTNIQGYCTEDLADYVLAAMYHVNKRLSYYGTRISKDVKENRWGAQAVDSLGHRLSAQTLAIIGFGMIGKAVAKKAKQLDMRVIAFDEFLSKEEIEKYGVEKVSWQEAFQQADFVSVHLKGCDENADKIGMKEFDWMKDSAHIINTARGKIIREEDLMKAVQEKKIAGAILDVVKNEPPIVGDPIFETENIIVTPHISYITEESFRDLKEFAIGNLVSVLKGERPRDPVY